MNDNQGNQIYSKVSGLSDGGFLVTWASDGQDGSGYGIYGKKYDAGGIPVGNEFLINSTTEFDQEYPEITNLQNGNFVVTWMSGLNAQGAGEILGRLFDVDLNPIGDDFTIAIGLTYPDYSVSETVDGGFIVSWVTGQGINGYSSDEGWQVGGQRFNADGEKVLSWYIVHDVTAMKL